MAREDVIADAVTTILSGLNQDGLTPMEGLVVAEILIGQLCTNLLKLAPPADVEKMRMVGLRSVLRIESRIKAWPATEVN